MKPKAKREVEYKTFRITIPVRRKKMPEAILKALIAARLIAPSKEFATVTEEGALEGEGFGYLMGPAIPTNTLTNSSTYWVKP